MAKLQQSIRKKIFLSSSLDVGVADGVFGKLCRTTGRSHIDYSAYGKSLWAVLILIISITFEQT